MTRSGLTKNSDYLVVYSQKTSRKIVPVSGRPEAWKYRMVQRCARTGRTHRWRPTKDRKCLYNNVRPTKLHKRSLLLTYRRGDSNMSLWANSRKTTTQRVSIPTLSCPFPSQLSLLILACSRRPRPNQCLPPFSSGKITEFWLRGKWQYIPQFSL